MVLAGMDLPNHPADARAIVPQQNEQVLDDESLLRQPVGQLHMGQALPVCAHLVPALDDVDSPASEDPMGLVGGPEIQVKEGLVVFLSRPVPG